MSVGHLTKEDCNALILDLAQDKLTSARDAPETFKTDAAGTIDA
jgi:hypothetical protein